MAQGSYTLFLSNEYIGDLDYNSKEDLGVFLKDLILLLKDDYDLVLNGFYEVNIYINNKLGMFIEINNIDDYDTCDLDVDLKIVVHFDSKFYFKTDNFDIVTNYSDVKFLDNNYYLNLDYIDIDEVIKIIEFGEFIYGDDCNFIKFLPRIINK